MNGLLIRAPWVDLILDGHKSWEIRGSNTSIRGEIALIRSGSGLILGTVQLVDSLKLDLDTYRESGALHRVPPHKCQALPYTNTHAWVLRDPVRWPEPRPYKHPSGAVIWVKLGSE